MHFHFMITIQHSLWLSFRNMQKNWSTLNSPVPLQQRFSFKLRRNYKNFKTGSTSIWRRVFYILKEKHKWSQTVLPSSNTELKMVPMSLKTCISIILQSYLNMQLLHTTCIAPISALSFSRIRSGVTDISDVKVR